MATLRTGQSCTIKAGQHNATVTNESRTDSGRYQRILGINSKRKHDIGAGQTATIPGHDAEAVQVKNIGKTVLTVTNCD